MKLFAYACCFLLYLSMLTTGAFAMTNSLYTIPVITIDEQPTTLESYRGQTLLIVNTASKCGFTKQFKGLQELYEKYADRSFVILGFPSLCA